MNSCARLIILAVLAACLTGCGVSLPNTTGTLFSGNKKPAKPETNNTVSGRAIQVGTTSARAQKCGFVFDAAKLRADFLAAESALGNDPAQAQKAEKIYDTAYRGLSKAVASKGDEYCSPSKTKKIKTALNRHLAGDFTPEDLPPKEEDEGMFSGWGGGSGSSEGLGLTLPGDNM